MTHAAPGAQVHQALDVHRHFAAQVTLDQPLGDLRTQRGHFGFGQILHLGGGAHARELAALLRARAANAVDVGQADPHVLVHRDVDTGYACHGSALPLLVARLGTDDVHDALAAHDLAVLADLLYRRTYLHFGFLTYQRERLSPSLRPPSRLAFFIKPGYWCDIACACSCAMKSITTTTTISSDVPPNWKGTPCDDIIISGTRQTPVMYSAPHSVSRVRTRSMYSPVFLPGRMPGMNAPDFCRFSAVSRELNTSAV